MWKLVILALVAAVNAGYYEDFTAKMIPDIVSKNPTWKAGHNPYFSGYSRQQMERLLGAKLDNKVGGPVVNPQITPAVPDTFDARSNWPKCSSIGFIRDQASCGSCWAVSSTEVMSDRTCIDTNGATQVYVSDEDLMTCCSYCGSGCDGGYPLQAFRYWTSSGIVTGGPYASHQGCQPYMIPPCPSNGCSTESKTPACSSTCESGYSKSFSNDKHFGSSYYSVGNGASGMQQELFTNGPIVSAFSVYEDFYNYVSGVYHHVSGRYVGGHAVKVIGWGTESGTPYWLVANSWNQTWGMQGLFKIKRGNNECGFESSIAAGLAKS